LAYTPTLATGNQEWEFEKEGGILLYTRDPISSERGNNYVRVGGEVFNVIVGNLCKGVRKAKLTYTESFWDDTTFFYACRSRYLLHALPIFNKHVRMGRCDLLVIA
jgi:hypothetical protein